jgi:hypothetical protein
MCFAHFHDVNTSVMATFKLLIGCQPTLKFHENLTIDSQKLTLGHYCLKDSTSSSVKWMSKSIDITETIGRLK